MPVQHHVFLPESQFSPGSDLDLVLDYIEYPVKNSVTRCST
jgi:hypothetical protein